MGHRQGFSFILILNDILLEEPEKISISTKVLHVLEHNGGSSRLPAQLYIKELYQRNYGCHKCPEIRN